MENKKKKMKQTGIQNSAPFSMAGTARTAGYCAISTEFHDHSLKKKQKKFFFQFSVVFFLCGVIKNPTYNYNLGLFES